jgi:Flp pilus assembly protein TadB
MAELLSGAAALAAGGCVTLAVLTAGGGRRLPEAAAWLQRRRAPAGEASHRSLPAPWRAHRTLGVVRERVDSLLGRAGWRETPERFVTLAVAGAGAAGLAGAGLGGLRDPATAAALGALGLAGGAFLAWQRLLGAARARRGRLLAELAPTLELMALELSGGNSPHGAIAAVTARTDGELSRELRRVLAAAAVSGAGSFEARLAALAARLDLPPLAALAAVMATSRDYGSGVGHGVRALAVDLRRAQRRHVIATSRRALTRVLLPAGVGVLLPFMAILLFPAVTALAASFR